MKQTFLKRRNTNGQLVFFFKCQVFLDTRKIQIKTTCDSSHFNHNGCYQEKKRQKMLARVWRKRKISSLLVGVQIGAATVKISVEFSQKTKIRLAYDLAFTCLGIYSKYSLA